MFKRSPLPILILLWAALLLGACQPAATPQPTAFPTETSQPRPTAAPYLSVKGDAPADQETRLALEDGAALVIPPQALDGAGTVTLERNPPKTSSLPPFDAGVLPLGDFYNIEVSGVQVTGPLELTLPFDSAAIPDQPGVLVAAIPDGDGWRYVPVVAEGNTAQISTIDPGDPIIAWHFVCPPGGTAPNGDPCPETNPNALVCDPQIALQAVIADDGSEAEIFGRVQPVRESYLVFFERKPAANVAVELVFNRREPGSGTVFNLTTDEEGNFSQKLGRQDSAGLRDGWNWLWAKATCDEWFGEISVESAGYVEFNVPAWPPATPAATALPGETPTPAPTTNPVPPGAIQIPDVSGLTLSEAIEQIEALGFGVSWTWGESPLEIGYVYRQAPAAGSTKVPSRTTVVLYSTRQTVALDPVQLRFERLQGMTYTDYRCVERVYYNSEAALKDGCTEGSDYAYWVDAEGQLWVNREKPIGLGNVKGGGPLSAIMWTRGTYLWLPLDDQPITLPATESKGNNDQYISIHSEFTFSPAGSETLTILGQDLPVQKYTGERDWTSISLFEDGKLEKTWHIVQVGYFDEATGLLVRMEIYETYTACSHTVPDPWTDCAGLLGKTERYILELAGSDTPGLGEP